MTANQIQQDFPQFFWKIEDKKWFGNDLKTGARLECLNMITLITVPSGLVTVWMLSRRSISDMGEKLSGRKRK